MQFTYFYGSLVLVMIKDGKWLFVGSESREAKITRCLITGEVSEPMIARDEDTPARFPGAQREIKGRKIYRCCYFILGATGNAKTSKDICTKLLDSTQEKFDKKEQVTLKYLTDFIEDELSKKALRFDENPEDRTTFLLITPDETPGSDFTITQINESRSVTIRDSYACIGCAKQEAIDYLLQWGPNSWYGETKTTEQTRSLLRDSLYKSAEAQRIMIGGPVIVYTSQATEDKDGERTLNTVKVEFPPFMDVFSKTLAISDLDYGLHLPKEWFSTCIFPHWLGQAKTEILKPGGEIDTFMRLYLNIQDRNFYKRPKTDAPPRSETYKIKLRNLGGNQDSFLLDCPNAGDFSRICKRNHIEQGSTVHIYWENEAATFCMWAEN